MTENEDNPHHERLTLLLHWKNGTGTILNSELDSIYNALFEPPVTYVNGNEKVIDTIFAAAEECAGATFGINIENKVVLAVATRLMAERYMIGKLGGMDIIADITSCQTGELFGKFKKAYENNTGYDNVMKSLRKVVLMTPESIHLNSFMYEPILDMSDEQLRKLYGEVKSLT